MIANLAVVLLLAQGAGGAEEGYWFVPDTDRYVRLRHGHSFFSIGKLDKKGNFLPVPSLLHLRAESHKSGLPGGTMINGHDDEPVYEFRSGRLVKGKIDKEGSFVPDVGEKVIRFEDYRPEEDITRIYNLPGKFVPDKPKERGEAGRPGAPATDRSPRGGAMVTNLAAVLLLAQGAGAAEGGYELAPDTDRWVGLYQGNTLLIGKLDRKGDFLPEPKFLDLRRGDRCSLPAFTMLNGHGADRVYEFRSGRLILGQLDVEGSFVPRVGERVIRLEDYKPQVDNSPIYNLPGKLVPKKQADKRD
jgi:hypothetical protein